MPLRTENAKKFSDPAHRDVLVSRSFLALSANCGFTLTAPTDRNISSNHPLQSGGHPQMTAPRQAFTSLARDLFERRIAVPAMPTPTSMRAHPVGSGAELTTDTWIGADEMLSNTVLSWL